MSKITDKGWVSIFHTARDKAGVTPKYLDYGGEIEWYTLIAKQMDDETLEHVLTSPGHPNWVPNWVKVVKKELEDRVINNILLK